MLKNNKKYSLPTRIFSAFFAVYMTLVPALPLAYLNPVAAATDYLPEESKFSSPTRYVREGNSNPDIVAQINTPAATDIRFHIVGVDISFSETVTDVAPLVNDSYDNDIY